VLRIVFEGAFRVSRIAGLLQASRGNPEPGCSQIDYT